LDLKIKPIYCGNKNCIGVDVEDGHLERAIAIEDKWTVEQSVIEDAMPGMVSHETVEYLGSTFLYPEDLFDLHSLLGTMQDVEDYVGNDDGIVFKRRGKVVKNPWQRRKVIRKGFG
jgi:hypothetical protein